MAFKCYSCDQERSDKLFGAILAERKICKLCLPYVDEPGVAWLIRFHEMSKSDRPKKIGRDKNK